VIFTKHESPYFKHVSDIRSINNSSSTWKSTKERRKITVSSKIKVITMLDQFHPSTHPYMYDIINVKVYDHSDY